MISFSPVATIAVKTINVLYVCVTYFISEVREHIIQIINALEF